MKERFWAALILTLMLLFWVLALASPVTSDKQGRSDYTLLMQDRTRVCVPAR
jgi:hypothetical protein